MLPAAAIQSSAANDVLRASLMGAGGRGTFGASLLKKNSSACITAVCDVAPTYSAKAKQTLNLGDAEEYFDFRDLLANKNIDAALIATPVFLHPDHLEAAIAAGKHIYTEKPAGADAEGARRVLRAADRADRKINITSGFQQRYGPGYRKAHVLVTGGALGPILSHSH